MLPLLGFYISTRHEWVNDSKSQGLTGES